MTAKTEATIEDLYHVPGHGKAEIIDGELVLMSPNWILAQPCFRSDLQKA